MRALKFLGHGEIQITNEPDPVPGPGEVVLRTVRSAICGSEMGCYRRDGMEDGNPGHEAAGIVDALGDGVSNLKIGDRVGISPIAGCGACDACRDRKFTWCVNRKFYGSMHAEKILAAASACWPLPDDVDWDCGVLLSGDGFGVPYHTSKNVLRPGVENVVIFGAGPIGLGNLIMQKSLNRNVFMVDLSEERLRLSEKLGATGTFNPKNCNAIEAVKERTGGKGADLCIEAAGQKTTAKNCFEAVKNGGQVIFNGEQGEVSFSISDDFIRRDITATGSWFYHFCEIDEMYKAWKNGLDIKALISHRFRFEDASAAYRMFSEGKTAKVLLCWD